MRFFSRLSYANVAATLALFLALTGTAVAGAKLLITGANVKNHSLTGVDIKNGSLGPEALSPVARMSLKGSLGPAGATGPQGQQGNPGPAGQQGQAGSQGATGVGVTSATVTGTDATNYQDNAPLASGQSPVSGDYVVFTTLTVHNTGINDEYLNCGFKVGSMIVGAAGVNTSAGSTVSGTSVGAFNAPSGGTVDFFCAGNGNTTYDISHITMRIHYLG